jgi:hypothetical protein
MILNLSNNPDLGESSGVAMAETLPIPYNHLDVVMGLIPTKDRTPACDSISRQHRVYGLGCWDGEYHSIMRRDAAVRLSVH